MIGQLDVGIALVEGDGLTGGKFSLAEVEVMEELAQLLKRKHTFTWSVKSDWEGEQRRFYGLKIVPLLEQIHRPRQTR